ncbi:hypothetical protein [Arthrobacter sp. ISL-69]|uniref:hypothetical protein n=1 Tax=Arthrobacter sp. ISL-69 TaxID=2819113 RepID=UPI001BEC917C|nr:hypothetical protein [Arthrobacter sp. ISL-69]MBT2538876.1 hypothetical protein [Arthrobacter sp. ISL-69]
MTDVARILNRPGKTPDVLVFGDHYIHCGQPMTRVGSDLRNLRADTYSDKNPDTTLSVYLATRVLRCGCGFQVELPA